MTQRDRVQLAALDRAERARYAIVLVVGRCLRAVREAWREDGAP